MIIITDDWVCKNCAVDNGPFLKGWDWLYKARSEFPTDQQWPLCFACKKPLLLDQRDTKGDGDGT